MTSNVSEENVASILRVEKLAKRETSLKQLVSTALLTTYFMLISCLTCSSNLKIEATYFPETSVVFSGLHSVTTQMTELYVPTTVRTSNPATDSVGHNVRE
jgi:hypothetical protein